MNNLLKLKGKFEQKPNTSKIGPKIPKKESIITSDFIDKKIKELEQIFDFFNSENYIAGALVSIKYNKLVAKSNRVSTIFKPHGTKTSNDTIVGAKFSDEQKHIITHFVDLQVLRKTINYLLFSKIILDKEFGGIITSSDFDNKNTHNKLNIIEGINIDQHNIAKTNFRGIIVDISYVSEFTIEIFDEEIQGENQLLSLYKVGLDPVELLKKIDINLLPNKKFNDTTILLSKAEIETIKQNVPYLISMQVEDFTKISLNSLSKTSLETFEGMATINSPTNEPTIGVIDTLFDERVYFSEWVEYHEKISNYIIDRTTNDYKHGTAVSSIIVDGHRLNPWLDDGCGNFRVRHFGVSLSKGYSSNVILKKIEEIVKNNTDIKVWNLSLGSKFEINRNFASPVAEQLDKIQFENDIIFVIAGTNKEQSISDSMKIGSPADSINSIVVNSVSFDTKQNTKYTREGFVLDFFIKPDVSYYGGDERKYIKVCEPLGLQDVSGTSFAAPWISRKLSYLIDKLGFSRESAKALLIDSAIGWNILNDSEKLKKIGYGIVPISIGDIVKNSSDEIRFVITGVSEKYDTYNYQLPVPTNNDKHPFSTKATLVYFPNVSRDQGVDYTNTELDLSFGRIDNNGKIKPINKNVQTDSGFMTKEEDARRWFRKWDNVKHISDWRETTNKPKKSYGNKLWGISVKTKERLSKKHGENIKFALVITLKELNGKNRIDDFIQMCSLRGWIVDRVDLERQINIYSRMSEEIEFE